MLSDRKIPDEAEETPASAFGDAAERMGEVRDYVSYYISAQLARLKVSVRNVIVYAIMGIIGLLAAAAVIVTAVVLLCNGLANGLGTALGGHLWLGQVIVGLLILGAVMGVTYVAAAKITGTSRKATIDSFESKKQHQRAAHGTDVQELWNESSKH